MLSLGKAGFQRQKAEQGNKIFRRSLYFVKDLPIGHILKADDIRRIRPGMGLSPKYFEKILGKKTIKNVIKGQAVSFNDFD